MGTTVKGRKPITTQTTSTWMSPPVPSNIPPMTPPKPDGVPAPFPHVARCSTAQGASTKLRIGGGQSVVEGTKFDIDPPVNNPSQPAPLHDFVTMKVNSTIET